MIDYSTLPAVNASLNAVAAVFLAVGYAYIRRGDMRRHRRCMLAAFGASTLFLASYLVYHAEVGSVPYQGQGFLRIVYFTILITHIVLAGVILPLALVTLSRALAAKYDRHKRIARWTLPIWLYVSVTGVLIYLMLYRL